jgi:hypothetical protein
MGGLHQAVRGLLCDHVAQHGGPAGQDLGVHVVDGVVLALEARVCALCCAPVLIVTPGAACQLHGPAVSSGQEPGWGSAGGAARVGPAAW